MQAAMAPLRSQSRSVVPKRRQRSSAPSLLSNSHRLMELLRTLAISITFASQLVPSQCFLFQSKRAMSHHLLDSCCMSERADDFCRAFSTLNTVDQHALRSMMGCETNLMTMEKRKPNFIRYGRSAPPSFAGNSRRLADPNFLRFGRSGAALSSEGFADRSFRNFFEKKSANGVNANFLRFGKAASDPNFLRFGKRAPSSSPILGAAAESSAPNFLRFGRSSALIGSDDLMEERFSREYRKPNFLRFG